MDAVGFGKPVLFGMSEGGPQAIMFAAKRPEQTRALILYGSFLVRTQATVRDNLDRDPAELRASVASSYPEVDEKYWPSTKRIARVEEMVRVAGAERGSGATVEGYVPVGPVDGPASSV